MVPPRVPGRKGAQGVQAAPGVGASNDSPKEAAGRGLEPAPSGPRKDGAQPAASRRRHVIGLVVNVFAPGAGTLLEERTVEGWFQLALLLLGLSTIVYLVGLAVVPAVWTWAVVGSMMRVFGWGRMQGDASGPRGAVPPAP